MGLFDSEKGLCHFVFANEDDYYLKSLVRLNLRPYLYCILKQKDFSSVYFLSGDEEQCELLCGDAAAAATYGSYEEQGIFNQLFNRRRQGSGQQRVVLRDHHECWLRLARMMKKEKRLALVVTMEAFGQLNTFPDIVELLCQLADKNYNRGHLLLILSPPAADASRAYLADADGVFQSDLFPEIKEIFRTHQNIHIYQKLKEELGDRVVYFNTLEWDQIYRMMNHHMLKDGPLFNDRFDKARDYADIVWAWYHSSAFRNAAAGMPSIQGNNRWLPVNEKRQMSVIERALENKAVFNWLDTLAGELHMKAGAGELKAWICANYGEDLRLRLIYEDNMMLRKLEQLPVDRLLSDRQDVTTEYIRGLMGRIREALEMPGIISEAMQMGANMSQCLESMQTACLSGDCLTFEKAAEALEYGICRPYDGDMQDKSDETNSAFLARWDLHMKTIQVAKQLYDIKQLYDQDGRRLGEYRQHFNRCLHDIRDYEQENAQVIGEVRALDSWTGKTPVSGQLQQLMAKKSEAVGLHRDIQSLEHLRATKLSLINSCKDNIQKMEMAISTIAAGNMGSLKENLDYAQDLMTKVASENSRLQKEINEASMIMSDTVDVMAVMNTDQLLDQDIDREFEELMREQLMN